MLRNTLRLLGFSKTKNVVCTRLTPIGALGCSPNAISSAAAATSSFPHGSLRPLAGVVVQCIPGETAQKQALSPTAADAGAGHAARWAAWAAGTVATAVLAVVSIGVNRSPADDSNSAAEACTTEATTSVHQAGGHTSAPHQQQRWPGQQQQQQPWLWQQSWRQQLQKSGLSLLLEQVLLPVAHCDPALAEGASDPSELIDVRWLEEAAAAAAARRRPFPMTPEEKAGGLAGDLSRLRRWLEAAGVNLGGATITAVPGQGMALVQGGSAEASGGWGLSRLWSWLSGVGASNGSDQVLASFPASAAITAATAVQDPVVGPRYRELLEAGKLDERAAIIMFLMLERLKGERSHLAPWLNLLPREFSTPRYFTEDEMKELKGTTLERATAASTKRLQQQWKALEAAAAGLLHLAGETSTPTLEDFMWADSVFWSRCQTLPVVARSDASEQGGGEEVVTSVEAIVPGLDFANHSGHSSNCRWVLQGSSPQEASVQLVTVQGHAPRPGQQLLIDYGDKTNEELLFYYGFTAEDMQRQARLMVPLFEWMERYGTDQCFFLPLLDELTAKGGKSVLPDSVLELLLKVSARPERTGTSLIEASTADASQAAAADGFRSFKASRDADQGDMPTQPPLDQLELPDKFQPLRLYWALEDLYCLLTVC